MELTKCIYGIVLNLGSSGIKKTHKLNRFRANKKKKVLRIDLKMLILKMYANG